MADTPAFRIKPKAQVVKHHVLVELAPSDYAELTKTAKRAGVSMKEFCRQAVRHALDTIEIDG